MLNLRSTRLRRVASVIRRAMFITLRLKLVSTLQLPVTPVVRGQDTGSHALTADLMRLLSHERSSPWRLIASSKGAVDRGDRTNPSQLNMLRPSDLGAGFNVRTRDEGGFLHHDVTCIGLMAARININPGRPECGEYRTASRASKTLDRIKT
jgi:hypothetical protein